MAAEYTNVIEWRVRATLRAPLRTGGYDGDLERVLTDTEGAPFIQGSSITGALRAWLEARDPSMAGSLFGEQKKAGTLVISDGYFDNSSSIGLRPRLAIDPVTGAAKARHKFDLAGVESGACLTFSLTWLGFPEEQEQQQKAVEEMLGALDAGFIQLGGQKSNGYGLVRVSCEKQTLNLFSESDRRCWLGRQWNGRPVTLPTVADRGLVTFTVKAYAPELLVKNGSSAYRNHKMVQEAIKENGRLYLPGSSWKGTILSRARAIGAALGLDRELCEEAFGRGARRAADAPDGQADNGRPCLFRFEDGVLEAPRVKIQTRIRIDKLTGGVVRNMLINEESTAGSLVLRLTGPAACKAGCALLLLALRDLALGLYNLGGGGATGKGIIEVAEISCQENQKTAALMFRDGKPELEEDQDGLFSSWFEALEVAKK